MLGKLISENKVVQNTLAAAITLILCWASYSNSLHHQFLIDDYSLILEEPKIHSIKSALLYFVPDVDRSLGIEQRKGGSYYRPLNHFPLAIYYHFFGSQDAYFYHLTNFFLFFIAVVSIYFLVYFLFSKFLLALLTAVLFATHPINGLMINYITAFVFSLEIIFLNLALILLLQREQSRPYQWIYFWGGIVSFMTAVLCHETALAFPLYWAAVLIFLKEKTCAETFKRILPVGIIALAYFIFRTQFASLKTGLLDKFAQHGWSLVDYLASFAAVISWYLEKLLTCQGILLMWITAPVKTGWLFYTNILFIIALIAAYTAVILKPRRGVSLLRFSFSWLGIGLLTAAFGALFYLKIGMAIEPHWLYYASIGIFVMFAHVLLTVKQPIRGVMIVVILFGLIFSSRAHNQLWKDEKTYTRYWYSQAPLHKSILFHMASAHLRSGELVSARAIFLQSLNNAFEDWQVYSNLGLIDMEEGKMDSARENFLKVLSIFPKSALAHNNLGIVSLRSNDFESAKTYFQTAITLNRFLIEPRLNLAQLYINEGQIEGAREIYLANLKVNPNDGRTLVGILKATALLDDFDEVVKIMGAVEKNVSGVDELTSAAAVLDEQGMTHPALRLFQAALEKNPKNEKGYLEAGKFFANHSYFDQAISLLEAGRNINPDNPEFDSLISQIKALSPKNQ
jgi:tetratricopeptide (TPR) repeat protein